jgi:sugar phosphate isomerase/epimerase
MKDACAYAGAKGVFLTIENHGYLTETADDLFRLLDGVSSDWLGINLDTGNFHGDPYEHMARAAPRAITCQVKTMLRDPETGKPAQADFARIARILRDARYRGYLALEYEGNDPHHEVPVYIKKLQDAVRSA